MLRSSEIFPATFGLLLIKLPEAVLKLDQDCDPKEGNNGDISKSEAVANDVLSFLDWRETILVGDLAESEVVRANFDDPLARVRLDPVAHRLAREWDLQETESKQEIWSPGGRLVRVEI